MKIRILCSVLGLWLGVGAVTAAEGTFGFRNLNPGLGVNAPIFDAGGQPLAGDRYRADLVGGRTTDSLVPAVTMWTREMVVGTFWTGSRSGYVNYPNSDFYGYPTVPANDPDRGSWLQVRAWDSWLGTTYQEVAARGIGGYGESPLFYAIGSDPHDYFQGPAPLVGLQSFSLRPEVPEPSVWLLLAGGLAGLWFASRRRALA
jgi:hypothetical protein